MIPKHLYLTMRKDGCTHAGVKQFERTVEKYDSSATEYDWLQFKDIYYKGDVEFLEEVLREVEAYYGF